MSLLAGLVDPVLQIARIWREGECHFRRQLFDRRLGVGRIDAETANDQRHDGLVTRIGKRTGINICRCLSVCGDAWKRQAVHALRQASHGGGIERSHAGDLTIGFAGAYELAIDADAACRRVFIPLPGRGG